MLKKTLLFGLLMTLSATLAFAQTKPNSAQAAYTDGKAALLPDSEIKSLKTVKAAVAVPTYLPSGFTLQKIVVPRTEQHVVIISMFYAAASGKNFQIQSTYGDQTRSEN